jgi:hypothetical protein
MPERMLRDVRLNISETREKQVNKSRRKNKTNGQRNERRRKKGEREVRKSEIEVRTKGRKRK